MPKAVVVTRTKVVRRRPRPNKGPDANPRKPLTMANREVFAQLIAKGQKIEDAYREAGYKGNPKARRSLRAQPDIDARIMFLLDKRIEDDTKARHKRHAPTLDRKSRILKELEALAFSDIRDVIQWTKQPILDQDGNVTGFKDVPILTPSHLLTPDQSASIKRVFMKAGELNVEWQDKGSALEKLAKIEGLYTDGPQSIDARVTNNTLNVGSDNALTAIKRLAFALAKVKEHQELAPMVTISHADDEHSKG
jgi:hypothetical protein